MNDAGAQPNSPATKDKSHINWAEIATLVCTAATLIGWVLKFIIIDYPTNHLLWKQQTIDLQVKSTESVSVTGSVQTAEMGVEAFGFYAPISPVFVEIKNNGSTFVEVQEIEFRMYVARFEDVAQIDLVRPTTSGVEFMEVKDTSIPPDDSGTNIGHLVGVIDPDAKGWKERESARQVIKPHDCVIPPQQSRVERRHIIAETAHRSLLTKVEVIVRTSKSTQRWYAFLTNPTICSPMPFNSTTDVPHGAQFETVPDPAAAESR